MVKRNFIFVLIILIFVSINFVYSSLTINEPQPNQSISNHTITINISEDDTGLNYTNISIYDNLQTFVISTNITGIGINITLLTVPQDGIYFINATSYNNSYDITNSTTRNVTIDAIPPVFTSLMNDMKIVNHPYSYQITATDLISQFITYSIDDNSVFSINITSGFLTNITALDTMNLYYLTVNATDTAGNTNSSVLRINITNDIFAPVVTIMSPDDEISTSSTTQTFSYRVLDDSPTNCSLYFYGNNTFINKNNSVNVSNTFSNSFTNSTQLLNFTWFINCTDQYGNTNDSGIHHLNRTESDGSDDSSDTGDTATTNFWINNQFISNKQFNDGYTQLLAKKNRIQFTVNNTYHYIGVVDLTSTLATINLSSKTIQTFMTIGDEKKFDLDQDNIYDIDVKLNNITNFKANITIKKTNESSIHPLTNTSQDSATTTSANQSINSTTATPTNDNSTKKSYSTIIIIAVITIIIIVIIIFSIYVFKNRKIKDIHGSIKVFDF